MYELLANNSGVNISINAGQLIEVFDYGINRMRREMEQQKEDARTESYLHVRQAAEKLGVSRGTLWRWDQTGYLPAVRIGGKCRYRMSDIKRILEGGAK